MNVRPATRVLRPTGSQEAAILEWELKGRDAASGAVAGGLQELLRAADGREGNAGVVDLMLR